MDELKGFLLIVGVGILLTIILILNHQVLWDAAKFMRTGG